MSLQPGLGRFSQVGVVFPVALGRVHRWQQGWHGSGARGHHGGQAGAVGQLQPGQQTLGQAVGAVGAAALTPIAPMWVFTPVVMAVMVPAESGVCESVL